MKNNENYKEYSNINQNTFDEQIEMASNPDTPPEVLAQLMANENDQVNKKLVDNISTPPEVLEKIFFKLEHQEFPSRYSTYLALAKNSKTPIKILERLVGDKNYSIKAEASKNLRDHRAKLAEQN